MGASLETRLWSRIDRSGGPLSCWPWTAGTTRGYGQLKPGNGRNNVLAHRKVMELTGYDVDGMFVCHRCDNPACCNPSHLFLGTTQENTKDRNEKQRQARGERQGSAKLTAEVVIEIRRRAASGEPQAWLAQEFGISKSQCTNIVRRRHWRHV